MAAGVQNSTLVRGVLIGGIAGVATALAPANPWISIAATLSTALAVTYLVSRRPEAAARTPVVPAASALESGNGIELDALIAGLSDPLFVVSQSLVIEICNNAARDLFGPSLRGESITLFLRHPATANAIAQAQRSGEAQEQEVHLLSPIERSYSMRVAALGDAERRLVISLRDITSMRLTERMRVDFVANASHELRTPLATLMGFIETLQGAAADDAVARVRFLEIMGKEADRMARLIDDLLSLSRIELDDETQPMTAIDVGPILADVGKTLAMRLDADGRRIDLALAPALPKVRADRDQVIQVMHNLLSNALKYGRAGSSIEIGCELIDHDGRIVEGAEAPGRASALRISVRDRGEGIAPEHLPRLTERFYRIDNARSRRLGGTGLGLAIVKHIVERHRGSLSISSTLGVGTTVTFTLPVASH